MSTTLSVPGRATKRIFIPPQELALKRLGSHQRVMRVTDLQYKAIDGTGRTITGYCATWDPDEVDDVILRGAFTKTIRDRGPRLNQNGELRSRIKFCNEHKNVIGLPLEMKEDQKGLWVRALISKTREGLDCIEKVKDGTIDSMSIGYDVVQFDIDDDLGLRILKELKLYEFSLVSNPANLEATVDEIKAKERKQMDELTREQIQVWGSLSKSVNNLAEAIQQKEQRREQKRRQRKDAADMEVCGAASLPFADDDAEWDADKAEASVRKLAGGDESLDDMDWDQYAKAFVLVDKDNDDKVTGYKLPFAQAVGGKLQAVPKAIYAIAAVLQGGRGGVSASDSALKGAKQFITKQYHRMDKTAPWEDAGKSLQLDMERLCGEIKSFGGAQENKAHAHTVDAAARMMAAAHNLMSSSNSYGGMYGYGSSQQTHDQPPNEVVKHTVDILADTAENLQKNCMAPDPDEGKKSAMGASEIKELEIKKGAEISKRNKEIIAKAVSDLQALLSKIEQAAADTPAEDGKSLDEAVKVLHDAQKAATASYSWTKPAPQ